MTIPQVLNFHVPKVFKFRMPLTGTDVRAVKVSHTLWR